ncbi:MAG TPA: hypothetical protein VJL88_06100 [Nitrospira sp.]|nr:hypothetical protein [Nitrospira sp.]
MQAGVTKERLMDLQRTVDCLQGRVQDMQVELRQATQRPLTERWWKSLLGARSSDAFMSACCNRRVRPNTRMVNYAGTRSEQ